MKKKIAARIAGWFAGLFVLLVRTTCRMRLHNDPRQNVLTQDRPTTFVCLHANQLAGSMACPRGCATIVSRSVDGEILVPALHLAGHIPLRGSNGTGKKGGATALHALIEHVRGGGPAMIAIDGPRGPRGSVQKGVGLLARKADTVVVAAVVVPKRRWILTRSWDRMQLPKPFSGIDAYCSDPLILGKDEPLDSFISRIENTLRALEQQHDPGEARFFYDPTKTRRKGSQRRAA